MTPWATTQTKPTFDQEEYARALVKRLDDAGLYDDAVWYDKLVLKCQDRYEMSKLIGTMEEMLDDYD